MHVWLQVTDEEPGLQQCRLLNASICNASVSLSGRRKAFQVVLYNPLAWERPAEPIRVPVGAGSEDAGWTVTGGADAAFMVGCRVHVQMSILVVRVPMRTDTGHIGPDRHRWPRQGFLLSDGQALAVQMEADLGSHLLLDVYVTWCTTGCAHLISAVAQVADMLRLLNYSTPKLIVICTFPWVVAQAMTALSI